MRPSSTSARTWSAELADFQTLETLRDGPLLRVWLSRADRLNAISPRMLLEIGDLFSSLATDFETKVVVLGGRGRTFCAGADRKPPIPGEALPEPKTDRERRFVERLGQRACRAIEDCDALTVARVHGHAVGGGCCFALSCDFRVATETALFRVPEVDLGVPLTWGAVPRLILEVGAARAREILLLCEDIDGRKAHEWGMVHRAVPESDLDATVDDLARRLADKPEMAVTMTKTQLRGYARNASLGDATEADAELIHVAMRSESGSGLFAMRKNEKK
jgi:enoyl-CoA hydratase/carnithine racemase